MSQDEVAAQIAPIVQTGALVLRTRATEVPPEKIHTPEFQALIKTMVATMREAPGVGLAAPQIGVPWRVIVLEDRADLVKSLSSGEQKERERTPFSTRVLVNPTMRIVRDVDGSNADERVTFFEGCLSVKGFVAMVERERQVQVTGLDENGEEQSFHAVGWPARIFQHEMDHLDGTLYIDRMLTRSFATVEHAQTVFAGKSIAEVREMLGV
jgi:peptide deformylase